MSAKVYKCPARVVEKGIPLLGCTGGGIRKLAALR